MKYTTLLVVAVIVSRARCQLFSPVIRTNKGYVKGRPALTTFNRLPYVEFLGIPFAKPPVGDLRFRVSHGGRCCLNFSSHSYPGLAFPYPKIQRDLIEFYVEFVDRRIPSNRIHGKEH